MKQWAKREERTDRVPQATVGMYGDLEGIAKHLVREWPQESAENTRQFFHKRRLLPAPGFRIHVPNTRAVPLARKGDAHQGRVSSYPVHHVVFKGNTMTTPCEDRRICGVNRGTVALAPNAIRCIARHGKET